MGIVINLKEVVLDYKPEQYSPNLRLHALEVLQYIERVECQAIIPIIVKNRIEFNDLAVITNY